MNLLDRASDWLDNKINQQLDNVSDGRYPWETPLPRPRLPERSRPAYSQRRPLEDNDVEDFIRAAEERPPIYQRGGSRRMLRVSTQDSFLQSVRRMYPLRVRRLQRDVEWLRRQAVKQGIDPDEVRWML